MSPKASVAQKHVFCITFDRWHCMMLCSRGAIVNLVSNDGGVWKQQSDLVSNLNIYYQNEIDMLESTTGNQIIIYNL